MESSDQTDMAPIPGHEEESIYHRLRRRDRSRFRSRCSSSERDGQSNAGASSKSHTLPEMSAHSVLETLKHVNSIREQHLAHSMLYERESKISSFLQIIQTLTQGKFRDGYTMKR
jgi:hypothetical protein